MEEEKKIEQTEQEAEQAEQTLEEDTMLPAEIDTLPLERETAEIVSGIVKAESQDELTGLVGKFSMNQAKKNALRVVKLNNLLDAVHDQAIERFTKRPDEISNQELLQYMKIVQEQIAASQQTLEHIDEKPMIQLNQQKNEVNIHVGDNALTRDSRDKVLDAVKELIKQVTASTEQPAEDIDSGVQTVELEKPEAEGDGDGDKEKNDD